MQSQKYAFYDQQNLGIDKASSSLDYQEHDTSTLPLQSTDKTTETPPLVPAWQATKLQGTAQFHWQPSASWSTSVKTFHFLFSWLDIKTWIQTA